MIKLKFGIELGYQISDYPSDFILNIHAAKTPRQHVLEERLSLSQQVPFTLDTDAVHGTRLLRLQAQPGALVINYDATVEIEHFQAAPDALSEIAIAQLNTQHLQYIYPSRYCQADRLRTLALREFGQLRAGYGRVLAIQEWVRKHTRFASNSSDGSTSAVDTVIDGRGVCRDFAHLMIALCRAISIPARFVAGIDYGADPALGPTDFHAYVEVLLGDRWYLFDPSGVSPPMGLIRLGTGRDAADVSFATIFGAVSSVAPKIYIESMLEEGIEQPKYVEHALSTCDGDA